MVVHYLQDPDVLPQHGIIHLPEGVGMLAFEMSITVSLPRLMIPPVDLQILVGRAGRAHDVEGDLGATISLPVTDLDDVSDLLFRYAIRMLRSTVLLTQSGSAAAMP